MPLIGTEVCYNKSMSFKIERNDITKVHTDAIVNTANPLPTVGRGTDTAVYNAAGREELLKAREEIGVIEPGHSVSTKSFNLKKNGIKYIIHTVGCRYDADKPETVQNLRNCYSSSLKIAKDLGCKSVAIPLLATGFYGFPKELGLKIAVDEISSFLLENEIEVRLVVYDAKSYMISEKLFDDIQNFLDENLEGEEDGVFGSFDEASIRRTLERHFDEEYSAELNESSARTSEPAEYNRAASRTREPVELNRTVTSACEPILGEPAHKLYLPKFKPYKARDISPIDVDAFIKQSGASLNFQNTLQQLIADRKLENATVYKKACIDKKFFSKIISNKDYVPKKQTVMALGLALELPLQEFEKFLASAGYAFMPSSKFDLIVKYCVMNQIFNLVEVDIILDSHGLNCFAPE